MIDTELELIKQSVAIQFKLELAMTLIRGLTKGLADDDKQKLVMTAAKLLSESSRLLRSHMNPETQVDLDVALTEFISELNTTILGKNE